MEEFKEDFLRKYFIRERREVKVEEFINLKHGNMTVGEYSLKFSKLSKYVPSIVSNPRDEMSHFVSGVADLVREFCTTMLHDYMSVARLMVYAKSIAESKLRSMARQLKMSGFSDQDQPRIKKRDQAQEEPKSSKVKLKKGSGSDKAKPTCAKCGKKHYGYCLLGTGICFGCG